MKEVLLSVIVPVYNTKLFLEKCIDSILNQIYKNLEIILIDDGSTDSSAEICDLYANKDERIKVYHQKNHGLIFARKKGVEMARGEWITFVDSDDWIASDMYSDMMSIVVEYNPDIVASGILRFYKEDNIVPEILEFSEGFYSRDRIHKDIIPSMLWSEDTDRWNLDPSLCTKIFKKEKIYAELIKVQDLGCYYGEDTAVIFPMMMQLNSMYVYSKSYYYHRQRKREDIPEYIKDASFFDKTYRVYKYLKKEFEGTDESWNLKMQLDKFYMNAISLKNRCYVDIEEMLYPVFPFREIPKDSRVVLYGAGKVGKEYFEQNEKYSFCNIVLWVDKNYEALASEKHGIVSPQKIFETQYDYIVIAIDAVEIADAVRDTLFAMGIEECKMVWHSIKQRTFV